MSEDSRIHLHHYRHLDCSCSPSSAYASLSSSFSSCCGWVPRPALLADGCSVSQLLLAAPTRHVRKQHGRGEQETCSNFSSSSFSTSFSLSSSSSLSSTTSLSDRSSTCGTRRMEDFPSSDDDDCNPDHHHSSSSSSSDRNDDDDDHGGGKMKAVEREPRPGFSSSVNTRWDPLFASSHYSPSLLRSFLAPYSPSNTIPSVSLFPTTTMTTTSPLLRVLVVGAGGIGCELLQLLCVSPIFSSPSTSITVLDMDAVALSNLHRQFLFHSEDVGKWKSEIAVASIHHQLYPEEEEPYSSSSSCSQEKNDWHHDGWKGAASVRTSTTVTTRRKEKEKEEKKCRGGGVVRAVVGKLEDQPLSFYQSFDLFFLAVDSIDARRWLNRMVGTALTTWGPGKRFWKRRTLIPRKINEEKEEKDEVHREKDEKENDEEEEEEEEEDVWCIHHAPPIIDCGTEGFQGHCRIIRMAEDENEDEEKEEEEEKEGEEEDGGGADSHGEPLLPQKINLQDDEMRGEGLFYGLSSLPSCTSRQRMAAAAGRRRRILSPPPSSSSSSPSPSYRTLCMECSLFLFPDMFDKNVPDNEENMLPLLSTMNPTPSLLSSSSSSVPLCTLPHIPRTPAHCIFYAKEYLWVKEQERKREIQKQQRQQKNNNNHGEKKIKKENKMGKGKGKMGGEEKENDDEKIPIKEEGNEKEKEEEEEEEGVCQRTFSCASASLPTFTSTSLLPGTQEGHIATLPTSIALSSSFSSSSSSSSSDISSTCSSTFDVDNPRHFSFVLRAARERQIAFHLCEEEGEGEEEKEEPKERTSHPSPSPPDPSASSLLVLPAHEKPSLFPLITPELVRDTLSRAIPAVSFVNAFIAAQAVTEAIKLLSGFAPLLYNYSYYNGDAIDGAGVHGMITYLATGPSFSSIRMTSTSHPNNRHNNNGGENEAIVVRTIAGKAKPTRATTTVGTPRQMTKKKMNSCTTTKKNDVSSLFPPPPSLLSPSCPVCGAIPLLHLSSTRLSLRDFASAIHRRCTGQKYSCMEEEEEKGRSTNEREIKKHDDDDHHHHGCNGNRVGSLGKKDEKEVRREGEIGEGIKGGKRQDANKKNSKEGGGVDPPHEGEDAIPSPLPSSSSSSSVAFPPSEIFLHIPFVFEEEESSHPLKGKKLSSSSLLHQQAYSRRAHRYLLYSSVPDSRKCCNNAEEGRERDSGAFSTGISSFFSSVKDAVIPSSSSSSPSSSATIAEALYNICVSYGDGALSSSSSSPPSVVVRRELMEKWYHRCMEGREPLFVEWKRQKGKEEQGVKEEDEDGSTLRVAVLLISPSPPLIPNGGNIGEGINQ